MTQDQFWEVIAVADQMSDSEEIIEAVRGRLENFTAQELIDYQNHFNLYVDKAYLWDLWGAIYLMNGGCGDDSFTDFRYSLISRGREVYEKALSNPDSLAEMEFEDLDDIYDELFNEGFGYIAIELYEEKTDKDIYDSIDNNPYGKDEQMGEEWDFDNREECIKRLPKLTERFFEE